MKTFYEFLNESLHEYDKKTYDASEYEMEREKCIRKNRHSMKHVKIFESRTPKKANAAQTEKTKNILEEKWISLESIARESMIKFVQKTLKSRENLEISSFIGSIDDNYGGVSYTYIMLDSKEYPLLFIPNVVTAGMDGIDEILCVLDNSYPSVSLHNLEFIPDTDIIWQGNDIPWDLAKKIRLRKGTDVSKNTGIA